MQLSLRLSLRRSSMEGHGRPAGGRSSTVVPLAHAEAHHEGVMVGRPKRMREVRSQTNRVDVGACSKAWADEHVIERLRGSEVIVRVALGERLAQSKVFCACSLYDAERFT